MRVALKIDLHSGVDNPDAVIPLLHLLDQYEVRATFFVAPGSRPRWPVWRRDRGQLHDLVDRLRGQGHEVGVTPENIPLWKKRILEMDAQKTAVSMSRTIERFETLDGGDRPAWCSPGHRMNADVPAIEERFGLPFASDTRGLFPFFPVTAAGASTCVQVPTTLPLIREFIDQGAPSGDVHQHIFMESQKPLPEGHVFTLEIENEQQSHVEILEKLIIMWRGAHWTFSTLGEVVKRLDLERLPRHAIGLHGGQGGNARIAVQGPPVNAEYNVESNESGSEQ